MGHESKPAGDSKPHVISGKALLAVAAWGASFVATRVASEVFEPFGLVAVRFLVGAAVLGIMMRGGRRRLRPQYLA